MRILLGFGTDGPSPDFAVILYRLPALPCSAAARRGRSVSGAIIHLDEFGATLAGR